MTRARRKQINELVEAIREEANLATPLTLDSLKQFIKELGGRVGYDTLDDDIDGYISRDGNNFSIILNNVNFASDEREKFTLSHELGHLFLHMQYLDREAWANAENYEDTVYARSGYSEEEYDAHEFAAALLMPKDEYKEVVSDNTSDNKVCNITAVAEHFGVSTEAALNRGKWLGILKW
jgi:Zn-dependent peptidase ImmA (M78 family)